MRNLIAPLLLVPALALAQAPTPEQPPQPQQRPVRPFGAGARPTFTPAQTPSGTAPTVRPTPAPTPPPPPPGGAAAPGARPQQPQTLRAADSKCVPLQGRFMLSFNKADIVDVLEQASRWTCRNFVYTDDVARGKITLLSKTPVTAEEAYAAFLAALNSNNIAVYATGKYYKLIRTADSKKNPIPTYTDERAGTPANEQPITKVIRLQYVDADQMRGIVGNFVSPQGSDVQAIPPDMIIITDIGLNIRRIERILEAVDRVGGGDLVRIVQIRYASAKDIADKINQIFQAQGRPGAKARTMLAPTAARPGVPQPAPSATGPGAEAVSVSKIIPDERTNKLIVIADEKSFQRILDLIDQLDVPTSGEGGIHVVFLKNANAEELAQTLSNLASGVAKRPGGGAAPGAPPPSAASGVPGTARPVAPAGEATAELFSGEVKITADKAQNALLVQASGTDFIAVQRLVDKLDRPRRQVFVEAVIIEVNLRNELQVGVGAHTAIPYKYKGETGMLPIVSAPGRLNSVTLGSAQGVLSALSLGGFLSGFAGPVTADLKEFGIPSIGILVQALQTNSDVNVLSTPHLVATDNEESEITVGQNVPFQAGYAPQGLSSLLTGATGTTGSAALGTALATGGLGSLYAPVQRQNVELRLKIKPQINEGGAVRLTIDEQTEEIADRDPTLGPTTAKRSVKTQVVAKDQSTIVLGGLIQDRNVRSVRKIPFLGSLPVIGWLFRDTTTTKQKTNLLLFLTPYIIRNEEDYRRIYEKKRKEQQTFIEQFYGRQPSYEIDIDFTRKAGPYAHLHAGVQEETSKLENGGRGGAGERVTYPPGQRPPEPGQAPVPEGRPQRAPQPPPEEEGTPVDRLDVQPEVPAPSSQPPGAETPPAPGTPPPGGTAPAPQGAQPQGAPAPAPGP